VSANYDITGIQLEAPKRSELLGELEETPYKIPTPDGKIVRHARSTSLADTLDDKYALEQYERHQIIYGLGKSKDLWTLARTHNPEDDKGIYRQIAKDAAARAASGSKANLGTAVHKMTDDIDRHGAEPAAFPGEWQPYLRAYKKKLASIPFKIVTIYIEQVVVNDHHQIAGRIDRVLEATGTVHITLNTGRTVTLQPGDRIIGDLKTGQWLSWLKFSTQLAIYAHNTATWHENEDHPQGGTRGGKLDVSLEVALLVHLPVSDPDANCHLYWVDLVAGYDSMLTSIEAKAHRAQAKNYGTLYQAPETTAFEGAAEQWVTDRLNALTPAAQAALKLRWPLRDAAGKPVRYADPTPEQTEALIAALDTVEAEHQIPFGPSRPGGETTTKTQRKNRK
jgi:hypothetical protein